MTAGNIVCLTAEGTNCLTLNVLMSPILEGETSARYRHMCGISGILKLGNAATVDAGLLRRMTAALGHRGPDGSGVYVNSQVGLGHARLSILDPEGGRQPMSIEGGALWITFNGEIFNY